MYKNGEFIQKKEIQNMEDKNNMKLCISRKELPELLGCGQATADRIAREAGARIKVGKRILILVSRVQEYLEEIAI